MPSKSPTVKSAPLTLPIAATASMGASDHDMGASPLRRPPTPPPPPPGPPQVGTANGVEGNSGSVAWPDELRQPPSPEAGKLNSPRGPVAASVVLAAVEHGHDEKANWSGGTQGATTALYYQQQPQNQENQPPPAVAALHEQQQKQYSNTYRGYASQQEQQQQEHQQQHLADRGDAIDDAGNADARELGSRDTAGAAGVSDVAAARMRVAGQQQSFSEKEESTFSKRSRKFFGPLCQCRRPPTSQIKRGTGKPGTTSGASATSTTAAVGAPGQAAAPGAAVGGQFAEQCSAGGHTGATTSLVVHQASSSGDLRQRMAAAGGETPNGVSGNGAADSGTTHRRNSETATATGSVAGKAPPAAAVTAPQQLITQVNEDDELHRYHSSSSSSSSPIVSTSPSGAGPGYVLAVPPSLQGGGVNGGWLLPPQRDVDRGKKTLVLDLDETLVHSAFKPEAICSFRISVEIEGQNHDIYVAKRPGVDEFMEAVCQIFEVVVFTASLERYANPVIDSLDPNRVCYRLFRDSCTPRFTVGLGTLNFVKDLSSLGRDMRHIIIVDNSPCAYSLQPQNAVPIKSWFNDPSDRELAELIPILEDLSTMDDVPAFLKRIISERGPSPPDIPL